MEAVLGQLQCRQGITAQRSASEGEPGPDPRGQQRGWGKGGVSVTCLVRSRRSRWCELERVQGACPRWAVGTRIPSTQRVLSPRAPALAGRHPAHSLEYTHAGSFTEINVQILKLFSKMA